MKKYILSFVCELEGFKTAIKQLHWDANSLSQHQLCDDIASLIADYQDKVAEVEQSNSGRLPLNNLKGTPYKVSSLKKFVEDVISSTKSFYSKLKKEGDDYIGMRSDTEAFLSDIQRQLYLVDFTIKESLKERLRNKINENRVTISNGREKYSLTENELREFVSKAIHNLKETTSKGKTMNKKLIRLTESDLHRIVKESVKKVIKEAYGYVSNDGNGRVGGSWGSRTLNATISVFSEIENAIYEKQKYQPDYENVLEYIYQNEDAFTIPIDFEESYDNSVGIDYDCSITEVDDNAIENARKILENMPTSNPNLKQIALNAFKEGVSKVCNNDSSIHDRINVEYPDYD